MCGLHVSLGFLKISPGYSLYPAGFVRNVGPFTSKIIESYLRLVPGPLDPQNPWNMKALDHKTLG